jgi:hypothetical protein
MSSTLRQSLYALAAGLAVAGGVWLMLPEAQPPPQALALLDDDDRVVAVEPGSGFYGLERQSGRRWAWAGGPATLVLRRLDSGTDPLTLRLRFHLHCIPPRGVTLRYGDFILWKGLLSEKRTAVDIPVFTLTDPVTVFTLASDRPGVRLDGGQDQRVLDFAVYDFEIATTD